MNNDITDKILKYKGYEGKVHYSKDDNVYWGTILNIKGLVTFEADNIVDLDRAFKEAVDEYIIFTREIK